MSFQSSYKKINYKIRKHVIHNYDTVVQVKHFLYFLTHKYNISNFIHPTYALKDTNRWYESWPI